MITDYIFMGIILALVIGTIIFLIWRERKKSTNPERPDENPIIINLMPNQSHGKAVGTFLEKKHGSNGRNIYEFLPSDNKKDEIPKIESVIANPISQVTTSEKGDWSSYRGMIILTPQSPDELPEAIKKDAVLGTAFTSAILVKKLQNNLLEGFKLSADAQAELVKYFQSGELTKDVIEKMKKEIEIKYIDPKPQPTGGSEQHG